MRSTHARTVVAAVATAVVMLTTTAGPFAQGRPKASFTVVADADGVRPGGNVRLALRVSLPEGVHVQSNQPRDPLLIATAVTPTLPAGVSLVEIAFPPSVDFAQAGTATPLSVFEQQFTIGIKLAVANTAAVGDLTVPIRVRYQACDERTCFAPLREDVPTVLHVVGAGATPRTQFPELFANLHFVR